ncbi:MAG: hypothetical protein NT154_07460 [Verrucomicrobia bacterium]|nr:hypothetical protein [Verrucomicrobiota bacterium]
MTSETEFQPSCSRTASVNQHGAGNRFLSVISWILVALSFQIPATWSAEPVVIDVASFGAKPDSGQDAASAVKAALDQVASLKR